MRELRRLGASAFENERVFVGVRKMVLAANDVANTEVDGVGAGREVVGGHPVGTQKREVFDIVSRLDLLAVDRVSEADWFACATVNAEAEREGLSSSGSAVALGAGKVAHARIEEPGLIGPGFFAFAGMRGSEVAVSSPFLKDGGRDLTVQGQAFGLPVLLVPTKVKPAQTFEDGVDGGFRVALDIGIVEAQDHSSSVATGVKPVEDEGASTANVQKTGGRRRTSNAKHNF